MKINYILFVFLAMVCASDLSAADMNVNIAVVVWRGETAAEQGFKDGLKELGYKANITMFNADQKNEEMGKILRLEIVRNLDNFDYIYTFGTTLSKTARNIIKDRLPHIFNIVTAPVKAGIVRSMKSTGGNVSGVSNAIPLNLQISTARKIKKFSKIAFIFNSREKNSQIILDEFKQLADQIGFKIVGLRVAPGMQGKALLNNYLQDIVERKIEIDSIYLPMDSFVLSNTELIGRKLKQAKIFSIGSHRDLIKNGVSIGVIPDYYELGKIAAGILDQHRRGKKLENIPVQTTKNPILVINKSSLNNLGIQVPADLVKNSEMIE